MTGQSEETPPANKIPRSISFTVRDLELLEWLQEYFGTTRSEAVRMAIRSFVAQLMAFEQDQKRKGK